MHHGDHDITNVIFSSITIPIVHCVSEKDYIEDYIASE